MQFVSGVRARVRVDADIRGMEDLRCSCFYLLLSIAISHVACACSCSLVRQCISNMAVALYMPALNLAIHPRAGRGQHNHFPLGRFRFSLLVTATMADGVSPTHHTVRVTF